MSKYQIAVPGTSFQGYARTEEIAQQVAAKLDKLPIGSRRRMLAEDRKAVITWEGAIVPRKVPEKSTLPAWTSVACTSCDARVGQPCQTEKGTKTSAHADRKRTIERMNRR